MTRRTTVRITTERLLMFGNSGATTQCPVCGGVMVTLKQGSTICGGGDPGPSTWLAVCGACSDATTRRLQMFFAAEMTNLIQLALLLTAEAEDTEQSLSLAIRDCMQNVRACLQRDTVSKKWIRAWTRRAVIRQAIRVVLGTETDSALPGTFLNRLHPQFERSSGQYATGAVAESLAILSLPKLERLVFVICGIERYSIQDCSLLLNESAAVVNDALRRATSQLG